MEIKVATSRHICTMFIAVIFTIIKMWKQTKYPLVDEWANKTWYIWQDNSSIYIKMEYYMYNIYKTEYYPALYIKQNIILP